MAWILIFITGCNEWDLDPATLTAKKTSASADNIDAGCTTCHGYPLLDINHQFHLVRQGNDNKSQNGPITCMDCHSQSIQIDSSKGHRPIPLPPHLGVKTDIQEYMTGLAHMNNKVDVVFDRNITNKIKFGGDTAVYNPQKETCSAIACHENSGPYSFSAPSKGIPGKDGN